MAKLFSAPAMPAECERPFSLSGRLFCKLREILTADHIDFRTCLNRWMNQKLDDEDHKAVTAKETNAHCVSQRLVVQRWN